MCHQERRDGGPTRHARRIAVRWADPGPWALRQFESKKRLTYVSALCHKAAVSWSSSEARGFVRSLVASTPTQILASNEDNMLRKSLSVFGLAAVLVWATSAQDARAVIGNASRAMGVDALKTVQYSATGLEFTLGQAGNPTLPWPKFIAKSYSRSINFETPASRADRVRLQGENPPRGGGNQP